MSLAHNGVLFLDELPEFRGDALEGLRQPMEDGQVTITRVHGSAVFPARFMLVCAMNPCKCGWRGHPSGRCVCPEEAVRRYLSRISGPILDRIDIFASVPPVQYGELTAARKGEASASIRRRVDVARERQMKRQGVPNARLAGEQVKEYCPIDAESGEMMKMAFEKFALSARAYNKILKVSRSIADLEGSPQITRAHLAEALQYRNSIER
jgi:magnesium chelatase family protein